MWIIRHKKSNQVVASGLTMDQAAELLTSLSGYGGWEFEIQRESL